MRRRLFPLLLPALVLATAVGARAWVLELPAEHTVEGLRVTLGDVAVGSIPPAAAELVLVGRGRPGREYAFDRRGLLRRLAARRLAGDVVLRGADRCRVTVAGRTLGPSTLSDALLAALEPWLPPADPDGPAPSLALAGELPAVAVVGDWSLDVTRTRPLEPGRNSVAVAVRTPEGTTRFTTAVECHVFAEVARARSTIAAGEALTADRFAWSWANLAQLEPGLATGRDALTGMASARPVQAGDLLREADVRRAPLVHQGEPVELVLGRGGVEVTIRGTARQDGARGQIISVRNELDGHLVTAEVVAPGRVAWRK